MLALVDVNFGLPASWNLKLAQYILAGKHVRMACWSLFDGPDAQENHETAANGVFEVICTHPWGHGAPFQHPWIPIVGNHRQG